MSLELSRRKFVPHVIVTDSRAAIMVKLFHYRIIELPSSSLSHGCIVSLDCDSESSPSALARKRLYMPYTFYFACTGNIDGTK